MNYVVINENTDYADTLPANTEAEIEAIEAELTEAGIDQVAVWAVPGTLEEAEENGFADAVQTSLVIVAN